MNFSNDFKWYRNSEVWIMQTLLIWVVVLIASVIGFLTFVPNAIDGEILFPNWLFFLTMPIACVVGNFLNYFAHITDESNKTYARFKYSEFKKWYGFRPERFIFEQASYLYFIIDPEKYKQSGVVTIENKDVDNGSLLCLMPKTFLDYCLYGIFIGSKYNKFKEKVEISKTSQNNREKARNLFILLNSLQSEAEKELKDSNKIIEEEIEKMRGVKMEREG